MLSTVDKILLEDESTFHGKGLNRDEKSRPLTYTLVMSNHTSLPKSQMVQFDYSVCSI